MSDDQYTSLRHTPLQHWPMSHLVMLTGIVIALATAVAVMITAVTTAGQVCPAGSVCTGPWIPGESWLLFITGLVSITFGIKRTTHTGLWRKGPEAATTTTTSTTTTKGPEPVAPKPPEGGAP